MVFSGVTPSGLLPSKAGAHHSRIWTAEPPDAQFIISTGLNTGLMKV